INQSKYALESLKKYSFDSCDPVDTLMVEKSKIDEDKKGKAVDPSHYCGMIDTLLYLTASIRLGLPTICYMHVCPVSGSAYRKALKYGKKDLSVSKRNRTSGSMVSEGFFYCSNSICRCGSCWLSRYTPVALLVVCNWVIDLLAGRLKGKKALRYPVQKLNILLCSAVVLKSFG
ncbi:hypothetical protein Tco_0329534, partial [Tanacetum coccineum]